MKKEIKTNFRVENINSKTTPTTIGGVVGGCWHWAFPAIAHVAGTAGTLDTWVQGFKEIFDPLNGGPVKRYSTGNISVPSKKLGIGSPRGFVKI